MFNQARRLRALFLEPDVDERIKHFLSLAILTIAPVYTIIAGIYSLIIQNYALAIFDAFFASALIISLWITIKRPRNKSPNIIISIASLLAFLSFFVSGGDHGTGYLWSLIVPLASSYLLGFKSGLKISLIYLLALSCITLASKLFVLPVQIPEDRILLRFLGIYLLLTLFQTAYEFAHRAITRHLNTEKNNFQAILSASPIPLFVVNSEREVLQSNTAATELFAHEITFEQIVRCGEYIDCINHGQHSAGCGFASECSNCELNKGIKSIFDTKQAIHMKEICVTRTSDKGDSTFWLRYSLEPVTLNGKELVIVALNDISDLKALNQKSIEMEKRANAANVAKSEFLANISHEIRTPMNGIIGMNGLLLGSGLNEEQFLYADTVRQCSSSLLTLLNDIIDYTKLEVGKLDLSIINFDLLQLVDDLIQTMTKKAQDKHLKLAWTAAADLPVLVKGDPGRLRQIFTNLLDNAIKFTQEGEVTLSLSWSAHYQLPKNNTMILHARVKDSGIGIEAEKTSMLFNKFVQIDASSTRHFGGTGLGLAICKELCELMDGKIGLSSSHGKGSEFWFEVQLGLQKMQVHSHKLAPRSSELQQVKILLVDSSNDDRFLLETYFNGWKMQVEQAKDGQEALEMLKESYNSNKAFQMLIVEQEINGIDGLSLGRTIRQNKEYDKLILILTHAMPERGDANEAVAAGFSVYLPKPILPNELHDCLVASLEENQTGLITRHSVRDEHLAQRYSQKQNGRIVLADDDQVSRTLMLIYLSKLGYQCEVVKNGQELIDNLSTSNFDLVLVDVNMPVLSGFDSLALIRNPDSAVLKHSIPVIAMTASANKGERERCLEAGMNDFLTKPVDLNALAKVLDKWLAAGHD